MTTDSTIPDGEYFLHPAGWECWIFARFSGGRLVGYTEEANMGTHRAAGDKYSGLDPDDGVEVDSDIAEAVIREVMGPDTNSDLVVVEAAIDEKEAT